MNKKLAILVHGWNVIDKGESSTDLLKPYFLEAGFDVWEVDYRWTFFLVKLVNKRVVQRVYRTVNKAIAKRYDRIVCVGHSNGCNILHQASYLYLTEQIKIHYVYINPALEKDYVPAYSVSQCAVWHTHGDDIVPLANTISKYTFGLFIPQFWGPMGKYGYQGSDPKMMNYDIDDVYFEVYKKLHRVSYVGVQSVSFDHTNIFSYLDYLGHRVVESAGFNHDGSQ